MARNPSRRSLLRASAGVAASSGVAALAGCSSLPFLGDDSSSSARDWLYDPTPFVDGPQMSLRFTSPARLDEVRDRLHPKVQRRHEAPLRAESLDRAATDWALLFGDTLFKTPLQHAWGGSFDGAAAADAVETLFGDGPDPQESGEIADLQYVSSENTHGAYRDGLAVAASAVSADGFERLIEGGVDGEDRFAGVADEVDQFLDAAGFDHTAQLGLSPASDGDTWQGTGTSYRVDGETTTVRWLTMHREGWNDEELRGLGESVDGLREVSVGSDGPVRWVEAVADTGRLALDGTVFGLLELPYDE